MSHGSLWRFGSLRNCQFSSYVGSGYLRAGSGVRVWAVVGDVGVWALAGVAGRTADMTRTKIQSKNTSVLPHERLRRGHVPLHPRFEEFMTRYRRECRRCESPRVPRRCGPRESPHVSAALAEFGNEQLRLLKGGEVTTFRNLVPVEELRIGLVAPYLRRCKKVTFEDAHRNWQIDGHTGEILCETLKVNPRRGRGGIGQPVQGNVIQHMIDRDGLRWITLVVAPCLKFLVDPHCLPNRRVGKTVPECLGTGPLDRGITRAIGRVFAELRKRQLLCRRVAARGC